MANLFWVGGSTAYDGTTNRLATTSGGTATVAAIAAGDTVTFDANSPASAAVTTSAAINCTSLTLGTGFTGSLTMSNSLTVSGAVTLTQGTLNTNGQTCSWGSFSSQNSNTRALTLGSSSITVTGTSTVWTLLSSGGSTTGTNATVSSGTSTITFTGAAPSCTGLGAGGALNNLVFSGFTGTASLGTPSTTMCANLTVAPGASKTAIMNTSSGNTYVVTGTYTLGGNTTQGVNRLYHATTTTQGSARNFRVGAVVITGDVDFADINLTYSGSPSWTNAGSAFIGDAGGNSSAITSNATSPLTLYRVGAGGNWSASNWSLSSGGATGQRVPLPQDDVNVDSNASGTITTDMPRSGRNMNFTGFAGTLTLNTTVWYGNVNLGTTMTISSSAAVTFAGRGTQTITSGGISIPGGSTGVTISAPGGSYTLTDNAIWSANFVVADGTFNSANFDMQINLLTSTTSRTRAINFGTSIITFVRTSAGDILTFSGTGLTFSGANATYTVGNASANSRNFAGGGQSFGTLTYTLAGSTGTLTLTGANTFGTINFSDVTNARTLSLPSGTTTTVGTFNVNGTSGTLMSVISSTSGTPATLTKTTGYVSVDYVSIKDSTATGGAWYAGSHSTNVSGNTGWSFSDPILPAATVSGDSTASSSSVATIRMAASVSGDSTATSSLDLTLIYKTPQMYPGGFYLGQAYLGGTNSDHVGGAVLADGAASGDSTATSTLTRTVLGSVSVSGDSTATSSDYAIIFLASTQSGDSTASSSLVRTVLPISTVSGDAVADSTLQHIAIAFATISGDSFAFSTDEATIFVLSTVSGDSIATSTSRATIFEYGVPVSGDAAIAASLLRIAMMPTEDVIGDAIATGILYRGAYLSSLAQDVLEFSRRERRDTVDIDAGSTVDTDSFVALEPKSTDELQSVTPDAPSSWPSQ